jgi:peptidylprolyl isomerase
MLRPLSILTILTAAACSPGEQSGEPTTPVSRIMPPIEGVAPKRGPGDIIAASTPEDWRVFNPENVLVFELERGRVVVALAERLAQGHSAQIKKLVREGFYDGLSFYRVIDGFVAQGGDVFETREVKNAAKAIPAEFDQPLTDAMKFRPIKDVDGYAARVGFINSAAVGVDEAGEKVWRLHCTGAMAMARNNEPDTGGTEFYIALQPQRYLDRNLTVFGQVVEGMDIIQTLRRASPPESESDDRGEAILSVRVAADLNDDQRPALEILRTDTLLFAEYVESRRNRPEEFFYYRPGHVDICALAIPVRPVTDE